MSAKSCAPAEVVPTTVPMLPVAFGMRGELGTHSSPPRTIPGLGRGDSDRATGGVVAAGDGSRPPRVGGGPLAIDPDAEHADTMRQSRPAKIADRTR